MHVKSVPQQVQLDQHYEATAKSEDIFDTSDPHENLSFKVEV